MKKHKLILICLQLFCAISVCYAQPDWNTLGNATTNPTTDFVGTTDAQPLIIKTSYTTTPQPISFYTSNTFRMILDPLGNLGIGTLTPVQPLDVNGPIAIGGQTAVGIYNSGSCTFVGWGAGINNAAGGDNTFIGNDAGRDNIITSANTFIGFNAGMTHVGNGGNTFLGWYAGRNAIYTAEGVFIGTRAGEVCDGANDVIIGVSAGQGSPTGDENVMIGHTAGFYNEGDQNVFVGQSSGENNTAGSFNAFLGAESGQNADAEQNVFIGYRSGRATTRDNNVFVGYESGIINSAGASNAFVGASAGHVNTTGKENVFVGSDAGLANDDDDGNTFLGYRSGVAFNRGAHNVYIGHSAGTVPTRGDNNVLLGYLATHANGLGNATAIGYNANVMADNNMILGNNSVNVGIGLSGVSGGPLKKLHVLGTSGAQFRLSYDYSAPKHTDFEATSSGYLKVNPTGHFTGFDLSVAPANVVDVNSSSTSVSGLKLRNLTSVTTPGSGKVLSLDVNNDVILVNDQTGNASVCGTNNIMARFTGGGVTFDCSDIFNDYSNSKVGIFNTSPNYNMHVLKPSMFSDVSGLWSLTYNPAAPHQYTLGVGCDFANNYHAGIGLFSSDGTSSTDRVQMFADDYGIGVLRTFYVPYVIMNKENAAYLNGNISNPWKPTSALGMVPTTAGIVIDNYFYENAKTTMGTLANIYPAKLWVESNDWIIPVSGNNGITPICALNSNTQNASNAPIYAVEAYCNGTRTAVSGNTINVGAKIAAEGADINYGIYALGVDVNAGDNYGGKFEASGGSNVNYAVYATGPSGSCTTTSCANAAGYFNGNVYAGGGGAFIASDSSLKTNIQPLQNNNQILRNLPVYSYNFLTNNNFGLNLPDGNHYGVMANELKAMLPDMVRTFINPEERDSLGNVITQEKVFDAVNYTELIPLLIAGYQQQANKLDSLTDALAGLQTIVNTCCNIQPRLGNSHNNDEAMTVELENVKAIVLNQNEPNPFAEQTTITWNIPADNSTPLNAMLMFYDNTGSILKTVKINETGAGSLLVYGSKLSQGIYTYSLVVNNKTIDSKKMVKSK